MKIKDVNGKYEIELNTQRGIVFEKIEGLWTLNDIQRYHQDYMSKVLPAFKDRKWAKCCDVRTYKASTITDELNKNMALYAQNGLVGGAIIVDSAIVKMQLSRSTRSIGLEPVPFDNLKDADEWLKTQGF
ncbi:MAG: hypothetical protein K0S75_1948 [Clostridia bacterium]|nr:hypothetical protein [Clostridia bacterium]